MPAAPKAPAAPAPETKEKPLGKKIVVTNAKGEKLTVNRKYYEKNAHKLKVAE